MYRLIQHLAYFLNLWEPSPKHLNLAYFVEFSYFLVIQTTDTYVLIIYALYAAMLWAI